LLFALFFAACGGELAAASQDAQADSVALDSSSQADVVADSAAAAETDAAGCIDLAQAAHTQFWGFMASYAACQSDADCALPSFVDSCLRGCDFAVAIHSLATATAAAPQFCANFNSQGCAPIPPACNEDAYTSCWNGTCQWGLILSN
jgi:hypothetical protein